jgi:hypothetical protein
MQQRCICQATLPKEDGEFREKPSLRQIKTRLNSGIGLRRKPVRLRPKFETVFEFARAACGQGSSGGRNRLTDKPCAKN